MEWDALLLSRLQFAFTIGFHIIFPAFTIGLASFLAVLEGLWLFTKRPLFKNLYLFWVKIFALSFGIFVAAFVMAMFFTPALTALIGHAAWWPGHGDEKREPAPEQEFAQMR